jgi:hypothetical protein
MGGPEMGGLKWGPESAHCAAYGCSPHWALVPSELWGSRRGGSDRPSELPTATADPAAGYLGGGWAASRVSIRHAQRFIQRSVPKSAAVTVGEF